MEPIIKHTRLDAFFRNKALNALMIVTILSLILMRWSGTMLLPVTCASLAFSLFIGYAIWFWIKKPSNVIVNKWLSEINGILTLYFLITTALKERSEWWDIFPFICAIITLFIALTNSKDEAINLNSKDD